MKRYEIFLSFSVWFETFSLRNCNKVYVKAYWTTHSFCVDLFNVPFHKDRQKFGKKIIESLKFGKVLGLFSFGVNLRIFDLNTAIIFSVRPTGQQTSGMLSNFYFLIHEVYRKFDKNCMKTLKSGLFCFFLSFLSAEKKLIIIEVNPSDVIPGLLLDVIS